MSYVFSDLAYAYGKPLVHGRLKARNVDFRVEEIMPIKPSGEGEHLWLKIEKDGSNTDWVAQQLAKYAGVKPMSVSYAGMKDRHAVTTQWFSIHLPGMQDPDFSLFENEEFRILETSRHDRKLKRGALTGNRFDIYVTDLQGDFEALQQTLETIHQYGVPNYYGEQRFGRDMSNLVKAERLFRGELKKVKKPQRGLYLSAARSWIFNQLLSRRIQQQNWIIPVVGDVYMLNAKSACFIDDDIEATYPRLLNREINLTGCLWGEGESMASADVLNLEQSVASEFEELSKGLEAARLKQERRSLRLNPENMGWSISDQALHISFELPAGAFATMVLRECVNVS